MCPAFFLGVDIILVGDLGTRGNKLESKIFH